MHRRRVQGGADREQHPGGAGGQVHGQPQLLLTRKRGTALVGDGVPGQSPDLVGDGVIACGASVAQVQDHAGPAVEEAGCHVERGLRGAPDPAGCLGELVVVPVGEIPLEHKPDTDAALSQVGHGPPAFVDLHAPVITDQATAQVLAQRGAGQLEQVRLADLPVQEQEHRNSSAGPAEPYMSPAWGWVPPLTSPTGS